MIVVMVSAILIMFSPFIIYRNDLKGVLKTYFTGAMVFFIGDSMIRYSVINMIQLDSVVLSIIVRSILSVIIAILFRVFVLKGVLDKERKEVSQKTAIVLGLGHAAMESFIVAYQYLSHFTIARAINDGTIYDFVSETLTRAQIDDAINILTQITNLDILGSLIILLFYVVINIGFYMMLIKALRTNSEKDFALISVLYLTIILSETILVNTNQPMIIRLVVLFVFSVLIMGTYIYKQFKQEDHHVKV
jgi:hypothetical protein